MANKKLLSLYLFQSCYKAFIKPFNVGPNQNDTNAIYN